MNKKETKQDLLFNQKKDMKNKTTIAIIIAGLLIAGTIYFTSQKEEMVYLPTETNNLEKDYRTGFMSGCNDGTNEQFCSCMYERSLQEYGFNKFVSISMEYVETNFMPKDMQDIMMSCL